MFRLYKLSRYALTIIMFAFPIAQLNYNQLVLIPQAYLTFLQ